MPEKSKNHTDSLQHCICDIKAGRMIIVVDDEDRENEGDLLMAASKITPRAVNFMATHGRGLICVPLAPEIAVRLGLDSMVSENRESFRTAFTVSVDAKKGVTTGISAHDRATTIRRLADPSAKSDDFVRPGHIFPLMAKPGGVLQRAGHTEAAVDLARLAGLPPAGVICEILAPDGTMARLPRLKKFAQQHSLRICSVRELMEYRHHTEKLVELVAQREVNTLAGPARLHEFRSLVDGRTHYALVFGEPLRDEVVRVRVHRESPWQDLFCGEDSTLSRSLSAIAAPPGGVFLYMRTGHMRDFEKAAGGELSSIALREYGLGAQILRYLGLEKIILLTRHPVKPVGLEAYGLQIVRQISLITTASDKTKKHRKK